MNPEPLPRKTWQQVVAIGAFTCCTVAHGEPAATQEQKFPPGYLESVSTGYENGQVTQAPAPDKTQTPAPGPAVHTLLIAQPPAPISPPDKKKASK
ncbi:hypothetical protein [Cupriavidus pinatubonensis]|uniref:hypothetical protein n=1 Tax=Cupriavidus pinatubonensis TaxID=248026 RepID=UPI0036150516